MNFKSYLEAAQAEDGIVFDGKLNLSRCEKLKSLGRLKKVNGDLYLTFCRSLETLVQDFEGWRPSGLVVIGDLDLGNCDSLKSLPSGLVVNGSLVLRNCTSLETLPSDLKVGSSLVLKGCTSIKELPNKMRVGGYIFANPKLEQKYDNSKWRFG